MQGTQRAPQTKAELEALYARRGELTEQIKEVTRRRGDLVQQRLNAQAAGNQTVAVEYESRIAELGQRLKRLEDQKLHADDMVTDAVGRGIGQGEPGEAVDVTVEPARANAEWVTGVPPLRQQALGFARENAVSIMLAEALFFVLGGILLWRTLARRAMQPVPSTKQLQTSVDAIALEVERISENQRYVTRLLNEKLLGEGAAPAEPIQARDRAEMPR